MIVIILTVGLAALLGMTGLAIDLGHAYLNKTRLQNLVDALALSGAKTLNDTRSTNQADTAISTLFSINVSGGGNHELSEHLTANDLIIEYSDTLYPFTPEGNDPRYARVTINSMSLQSWFITVLGVNQIPLSAQAVAGPSGTITNEVCHTVPLLACGSPGNDPSQNNGSNFWGYTPGSIQLLKATSKNKSECVGSGNFHLISAGNGNSGASAIREALAGNQEGCTDFSGGVTTKPGNTVGPTMQGLNTRFGEYLGPMSGRSTEFPPDVIVQETTSTIDLGDEGICQGGSTASLDYSWANYQADLQNQQLDYPHSTGVMNRRIIQVVIGDCGNGSQSGGRTTIPFLGVGCFFLLKRADSNGEAVYGEFLQECMQDGTITQSGTIAGPYKIVLHRAVGL